MDLKLNGKVCLVTGAARGMGRVIALRLAQEGADVVVAYRTEPAKPVVDEIKALGRKAIAVKADVTKTAEVEDMVKAALDEFGKIDILVNVAGGGRPYEKGCLFHESNEEMWTEVINLNLMGTMRCTRAVINHMMERRTGKIVNIGSMAGEIGKTKLADYS